MKKIFLSCPVPANDKQKDCIMRLRLFLEQNGLRAITLGFNEYTNDVPLVGICRAMNECVGLMVVAFKRYEIVDGKKLTKTKDEDISGNCFTSPFCQIEPAIAFTKQLPIMVLCEKGVRQEGMLETNNTAISSPTFDICDENYFTSAEFMCRFKEWKSRLK